MPVSFEVQSTANLGGTFSEQNNNNSRYGYFQQGVESLYVKDGTVRYVRILPARDPSFSLNDPAWLTSVIPYRDNSNIDPDTKLPGYTSWYLMVRGYKFAGRTGASFLSPATLRSLGIVSGAECPLQDIRRFAKDNDNYKHLMEVKLGTGKKSKDLLPKIKYSPILNVLSFDERYQPEKVCILEISQSALEDMQRKLSMPRPAGQNPVTPNWDRFMLGDVTDPMTGLVARIKHGIPAGSSSPITTALVSFSDNEFMLQNSHAYAIDPNTPTGNDILKARYNLFSDKTLKIWSYQEIVDWAVEDNTIPYELIQEACSHGANIPARPAQNPTHSFGGVAGGFGGANNAPPAFGGGAPSFGTNTQASGFGAAFNSHNSATSAPAGFGQSFGNGAPASFGGAAPSFGGQPATPVATFGGQAPSFGSPQAPAFNSTPASFGGQSAPAFNKPKVDEDDVPYNDGVTPPSIPATPAPALPPTPVVEEKFWVINGNSPVLNTRTQVQDWINAGYSGPVMTQDQKSGWKSATDFGFSVKAPAAPAVPVVPAAPSVPSVPPAAPANVTPTTPALAAPVASKLTPQEEARLIELTPLVTSGKVDPVVLTEFVALMDKRGVVSS